jgi:hypothetical protein
MGREVTFISDFAKVYPEEESEERLEVARQKTHNVLFLHRLREYDKSSRFNYCFGVLQRLALRWCYYNWVLEFGTIIRDATREGGGVEPGRARA